MITVPARRLEAGDRIEGREEIRRVGWYLDPDDDQAEAQILVTDTAGREYLFDRTDLVAVDRATAQPV